MEKRTQGAWIIHHSKKLNEVVNPSDFEDIELAGKCGIFLSNLSSSENQRVLVPDKVNAIRTVSNIKKSEVETVKAILKENKLIDYSIDGSIAVLGITTSSIINHTSDIFNNLDPNSFQKASLELTNFVSDAPTVEKIIKEQIADTFNLDKRNSDKLFLQSEEFGLVDYEDTKDQKIYFNGNLFRKNDVIKTSKVLETLKLDESQKILNLNNLLLQEGCISYDRVVKLLGANLLTKLQSIGMYDFNEVSNDVHTKVFITKPASFSKYGHPFEEDALDLAKVFISSFFYGMTYSSDARGRIKDKLMLINTINKLIRGEKVGPCTAIGKDYKILELKGVIQLEASPSFGKRYYMSLLKKEIGILALAVVQKGDTAEQISFDTNLNSSSVTNYVGPEEKRMQTRRKKKIQSGSDDFVELLRTIRD
jgi:hypothetical protein